MGAPKSPKAPRVPAPALPPDHPDAPLVYTAAEAAFVLRVSVSKLYELVAQGALPPVDMGDKCKRVSRFALLDYVRAGGGRARQAAVSGLGSKGRAAS